MAFRLPSFNLVCNIWTAGGPGALIPPSGPPTATGVQCQLRFPIVGALESVNLAALGAVLLLVPKGTDIRGAHSNVPADTVECPAGTGRFYLVRWVEDRAKGFPNEHRVAGMRQQNAPAGGWPYPTP